MTKKRSGKRKRWGDTAPGRKAMEQETKAESVIKVGHAASKYMLGAALYIVLLPEVYNWSYATVGAPFTGATYDLIGSAQVLAAVVYAVAVLAVILRALDLYVLTPILMPFARPYVDRIRAGLRARAGKAVESTNHRR